MAFKGYYIETDGLQKVIRTLKNYSKEVEVKTDAEIGSTAQKIETLAAQAAPKDQGFLTGNIKATREAKMQWEVAAQSYYAPYLEFGTKKLVQVPPGLEQYAAQFKGPRAGGGTFKDFVRNIYEWMKRNGIKGNGADQTVIKSGPNKGKTRVKKVDQDIADIAFAYAIARKILTKGLEPKPFLFPAYFQETEKLKKRLAEILKATIK
jgi:HK97 gp10 family phage protein